MKPKKRWSNTSIVALRQDIRTMLNQRDEFHELLRRERLEVNLILAEAIRIRERLQASLAATEEKLGDANRRADYYERLAKEKAKSVRKRRKR